MSPGEDKKCTGCFGAQRRTRCPRRRTQGRYKNKSSGPNCPGECHGETSSCDHSVCGFGQRHAAGSLRWVGSAARPVGFGRWEGAGAEDGEQPRSGSRKPPPRRQQIPEPRPALWKRWVSGCNPSKRLRSFKSWDLAIQRPRLSPAPPGRLQVVVYSLAEPDGAGQTARGGGLSHPQT